MIQTTERRFFPALLGALHQEQAEGELILEQNDGIRRAFWEKGNLVYLQSDVAGEQFGNYLIRQGILDREALQELLSGNDDTRFGDRVVQWGLVTTEERDRLLQRLLEQILLNALEHPVVNVVWEPGPIKEKLSADLRFHLDHRPLIWETFQQIKDLTFLVDLLYGEPDWRWSSQVDLLVSLSDLPLTTEMAFALSLLGGEPVGYELFMSATRMQEDDAARLMVALWALGSFSLIEGKMPTFPFQKEKKVQAGGGSSKFSTGQMPLVDPSAPPPPDHEPFQRRTSKPVVPAPLSTPQPPRESPPAFAPPLIPPSSIPLSWSGTPQATPEPPRSPQPEPLLPRQPSVFAPAVPHPSQDTVWGLLPDQPAQLQQNASFMPPVLHPTGAPEPTLQAPQPEPEAVLEPKAEEANLAESSTDQARKFVKKAKILLIQGRTGEAIRALEDSVRMDPDSKNAYEAWVMLGKLRLSNPAWMNRAVEALQRAARLNPKAAEPWVLMGELYLKKEFKANAVSCFQKAVKLDSSVVIPKDLDLEAVPAPPPLAPVQDKKGLLGRIKGLFS